MAHEDFEIRRFEIDSKDLAELIGEIQKIIDEGIPDKFKAPDEKNTKVIMRVFTKRC